MNKSSSLYYPDSSEVWESSYWLQSFLDQLKSLQTHMKVKFQLLAVKLGLVVKWVPRSCIVYLSTKVMCWNANLTLHHKFTLTLLNNDLGKYLCCHNEFSEFVCVG